MEIVLFMFILLYGALMVFFMLGNLKLKGCINELEEEVKVSVVVPFRNEEENLPTLISCLKKQDFPKQNLEIILVNDQSEDGSLKIAEMLLLNLKCKTKLLSLEATNGKKAAIELGVNEAKGEMILSTDADCTMGKSWVLTMSKAFVSSGRSLVLGRVKVNRSGNSFTDLFIKENEALMKATSGATAMKKPFLSNGANLGYSKVAFLNSKPYQNNRKTASGDDVFLLHKFKQDAFLNRPYFVLDLEATVCTDGPASLKEFIHQRIRWLSKSKHYTDADIRIFGVFIFLANLSLVFAFILNCLGIIPLAFLLSLIVFKWAMDFFLLRTAYRQDTLVGDFLGVTYLTILYPFYTVSLPLLSLFWKTSWKERKL